MTLVGGVLITRGWVACTEYSTQLHDTVALEQVMTGTRNDLMSTFGRHYWHCAFYQRRVFRLVESFGGDTAEAMRMTNRDLEAGTRSIARSGF